MREGSGAPKDAPSQVCTSWRCRATCDRHASLPALDRGDFGRGHRASSIGPEGLPLTLSRQHWRRPSSDRVQPLKAAPSSGADDDRASWDEVTSLVCRRRLPAPPTERLRGTPSVNGDGEEHSRNKYVRQAYIALIDDIDWRDRRL